MAASVFTRAAHAQADPPQTSLNGHPPYLSSSGLIWIVVKQMQATHFTHNDGSCIQITELHYKLQLFCSFP